MATPKTTVPKINDSYFWEPVVFFVEGSLYKVPKYHFEKNSEVFQSMFSRPGAHGQEEAAGNSNSNPIKLDGVRAMDFLCLLDALYPLSILREDGRTKDDWISILKLATLWRFLYLRTFAIDNLTKWFIPLMYSSEKISLGRQFYVSSWIKSGYIDLVMQAETLTMETAKSIGYETAVRVYRLRDGTRKLSTQDPISCQICGAEVKHRLVNCNSHNDLSPNSTAYTVVTIGLDKDSVCSAVETEFVDELSQVSKDGSQYADKSWGPKSPSLAVAKSGLLLSMAEARGSAMAASPPSLPQFSFAARSSVAAGAGDRKSNPDHRTDNSWKLHQGSSLGNAPWESKTPVAQESSTS